MDTNTTALLPTLMGGVYEPRVLQIADQLTAVLLQNGAGLSETLAALSIARSLALVSASGSERIATLACFE